MTKQEIRIVFMGTPEFAVASLRALMEGGYNVVGVVTTPDRAIGRHASVLQPSAVAHYAAQAGLPTLKPEKLRDETFLSALRAWRADLQIVVAFRMLPEAVWAMPRFGTFNLHASLLPQYRGAAPVNHAIINGETQTGVTTFFIAKDIDTGRIILQRETEILESDNAGTLHDRLMQLGSELVTETVDLLLVGEGTVAATPQEALCSDLAALKPAPKLFNDTCRIDWNRPAEAVYNFIRGLAPYPAAWTNWRQPDGNTGTMKIYEAETVVEPHALQPGTIRTDGKKRLDIAVTDGFIRILSLQPSGKKRMTVIDFLNGTNISFTDSLS